jgi:hypothetical protein
VKREWREVGNVTKEELSELEASPAGATLSRRRQGQRSDLLHLGTALVPVYTAPTRPTSPSNFTATTVSMLIHSAAFVKHTGMALPCRSHTGGEHEDAMTHAPGSSHMHMP